MATRILGPVGGPQADDYPDLPPVVVEVPDDPRELEADLAAWQREERERRRHERRQRLLPAPLRRNLAARRARTGISGVLVLVVLLVVALSGALLTVLAPRPPHPAQPLPLARSSAPVGTAGGLVPKAALLIAGRSTTARAVRPAVLAIVPTPCRCAALVAQLARQTQDVHIAFYVVTAQAPNRDLVSVIAENGRGWAVPAYDKDGVLTRAFGGTADGPVVVPVHADGVIRTVLRGAEADGDLSTMLADLDGAAPGSHS